jgi:hypothetical protein
MLKKIAESLILFDFLGEGYLVFARFYFPMQKLENILPSKSSDVN